jgi:hypothetical protein
MFVHLKAKYWYYAEESVVVRSYIIIVWYCVDKRRRESLAGYRPTA